MRKVLLSAAALAGTASRRSVRLFLVELAGLVAVCVGIAAFSVPCAAIVAGVAVIVAAEVRA